MNLRKSFFLICLIVIGLVPFWSREKVKPRADLVGQTTLENHRRASRMAGLPRANEEVNDSGLTDFEGWAERYLKASEADKAELEKEGHSLAKIRRKMFKAMIVSDPQRALMNAVPMVVRQQLPPEIVALLEERVADRGVLRSYWRAPDQGSDEAPVIYYVETQGGGTWRAYVYGRRAKATQWIMDASLNGVAMDGEMAVNESPIRVLEVGEVVDASKKTVQFCPVSEHVNPARPPGEPVTEQTTVVEAFDEIVYLCKDCPTEVYEETLVMGEASSGGAKGFTGILPAAPAPTVGELKVLCIPAIFPDQGQVPLSEAALMTMMHETAEFYQTMSYGRITLVPTITTPVILPRNQAWYRGKDRNSGYIQQIDGGGLEMAHAKEEARKLGYNWQDYHVTLLRANGGPGGTTSMAAGANVWMRDDGTSTCCHEIGHAIGLSHANFWQTNGTSVIGPGGNVEYGYFYDNMGTGQPTSAHWNVCAKNKLKWLPDEFAPPITRSGTYRIHAFDTPRLDQGKLYALRVVKDHGRTYWGEFRSLFPSNPWVSNGLLLGWSWPALGDDNLQLLDTTPGSSNDRSDAAIALGQTFSDHEAGIHITTLAVNTDTVPGSLDMRVHLGHFPENQPPTLSLEPSVTVVPLNTPVTFTATAEDPDGDELSYGWIWPDNTISPNASQVTRSFATNGVYTLSCMVSDMKGGAAIRNAVITVGTGGGRFTISGRIAKDDIGLQGIHVSASGSNGTLTDNDGFFTLSNLIPGTYTVTPARQGLVFNGLFNNAVTVGPSFVGADFAVSELPVVTVTAPDPVAGENGDAGTFRLHRTGSTASSLTVYVFVAQGAATRGADYIFSPDYTPVTNTPWQTFVIPEGAAYLDVEVIPTDDTAEEGTESVTLVLGQDSGFSIGNSLKATVAIMDNDTPLARVSLTADRTQMSEAHLEPLICTVTRTGSTTSSLDIPYSVIGSTAVAGEDYQALLGVVTIPQGAESASIPIVPVNDSVTEDNKILRLTISTNAAFIADASADTLLLRILDEDTQTVSLTVSDAVATEVDLSQPNAVPDPGVFLLTREGDLSTPLTVYYGVAGLALHGTDYEALSGSVTFAAGATQATVSIIPILDDFGEIPEAVVLQLGAGYGGYSLGDSAKGAVMIHDSGSPPLLEVRAQSVIATEPSSNGNFRITCSGGGTDILTVRYKISGTATPGVDYHMQGLDYTTLEGVTTIQLTQELSPANITVQVLDDADPEELETIVLTLLPDPTYTFWEPRGSTTMLLRDNDQPTIFVDGQVGNTGAHFVAENATGTSCRFWISRTGSTASPLMVNYSLAGTATPGADYTALSGEALIPAGAPGVDVTFNTIDDAVFEGSETITLHLEPGSYARGADATLYITDNETGGPVVAFASSGGSGLESVTEVNIPVRLSEASDEQVSVQYALDAGTRSTTIPVGRWIRIVKTDTSFETFLSLDGVTYSKTGSTRVLADFPDTYLAGLVLSSGSTSATASVEYDQVSITGLSPGGSMGARMSEDIFGSTPLGSDSEMGGVHRIQAGGPDLTFNGTSDGGHVVYFPITHSANCILTARVLNFTSGSGSVRPGIIIRDTMAAGSRRFAYVVDPDGRTRQIYRAVTDGNSANALIHRNYAKPVWLRLQRTGDVFTAATSLNGTTFEPFGSGQTLPLGEEVLVGLAASARSDTLIAEASFDQFSITPTPAGAFQDRPVGYLSLPCSVSQSGGTYTITASGAGIMPSINSVEDRGYFYFTPQRGDFTLTARLLNISGGATGAQAGIMVRDSVHHRGRAVYLGTTGTGSSPLEYRARLSSATSGEGAGIDYLLEPGTLTFEPGEVEKTIPLKITDDAVAEPNDTVQVLLSHPVKATLGLPSGYAYQIQDDDQPLPLKPIAGFVHGSSTHPEAGGSAEILVALSRADTEPVFVVYGISGGSATAGSDYTAISGVLTFNPGETVKAISLPILLDNEVEPAETVVLELTLASRATLSTSSHHLLTIEDADTPVVSMAVAQTEVSEDGTATVLTAMRTGSLLQALTVSFSLTGTALDGEDYEVTPAGGVLTFLAGEDQVELNVKPLQDALPEIDETVIVTLTSGSGYLVGANDSISVTLRDDDVNTVTLTASRPQVTESRAETGELTLKRTGPLAAALTISLNVTGTAFPGWDYEPIETTHSFAIGQDQILIPVTVLPDVLTEGNEVIVVSIASSGSYIVGSPFIANVTVVDDDLPPSVLIRSPAAKATLIAEGNGLMLEAVGTDDGLPGPLTYAWSRIFGPGSVIFENPASSSTGVTFSTPGVHGLRVTVSDGQASASDVVFVQYGGFALAEWVSQDQGPPLIRGTAGQSDDRFTLVGSGTGYSSWADSGHMLFRQVSAAGTVSITARLTGLMGPGTRLAGITLRDTSWSGSRRVNLLLDGSGNVQFRDRYFADYSDEATVEPGAEAPLWLRLELSEDIVIASIAPDVGGMAGEWTEAGRTFIGGFGEQVIVGMVVSSGIIGAVTSTAEFDQVNVVPAFTDAALHSEDIGYYWSRGSSSVTGSQTTLSSSGYYDSDGGHFRYQQVWGDCVVTARLLGQTGIPRGAQAGIAIRDTTDSAAHAFYGRTTLDGFQAHWRSVAGGSPGTLQTSGSLGNWVRLIRKGSSITVLRAADAGGIPGAWSQMSGSLPVSMTGPLLVGLVVDSNSTGQVGTGTFSNLTVEPLNTAPVVDAGPVPDEPIFLFLNGSASDDGLPDPPGALTLGWTHATGQGTASFSAPTSGNSQVIFSRQGSHTLRLMADDGDSRTYADLTLDVTTPAYTLWQLRQFANGPLHPLSGRYQDADQDGYFNLLEYALDLSGISPDGNPVMTDWVENETGRYLRITVAKNPDAQGIGYQAEATADPGDLSSWTSVGLVIEEDTPTLLRVRDGAPVGVARRRFMRIRVFEAEAPQP